METFIDYFVGTICTVAISLTLAFIYIYRTGGF